MNLPPRATPTDRAALQSLRIQFEACADLLAFDLAAITMWLAHPADARPKAFASVSDHMNECRDLLGRIEAITRRAERGVE